MFVWVRPLKAGPSGELAATERYRVAGGRSGTPGTEPLAKNSGACPGACARGCRRRCAVGQHSARAHRGSGRSHRRPSSERSAGPLARSPSSARQHHAPAEPVSELRTHTADLVQHAEADQVRPAAVTAATAETPLQITCPHRSPEPAAVTAKTPKFGLEITAAWCVHARLGITTTSDHLAGKDMRRLR
jgi:hypothetical protein